MKEQIDIYPELFEYYPSNGIIEIYNCVNRSCSDFESLLCICKFFAKQGKHCILLPKSLHHKSQEYKFVFGELFGTKYERKCPDLKIDNYFYEYEGFISNNPKKTFCNMIARGIKQSNRIIINECKIGRAWARRYLYDRFLNGDDIKEVWMLTQIGNVTRLF